MKFLRKRQARKKCVPFQMKAWYNLRAFLGKEDCKGHSFIECFDKDNKYINCPGIGGTVVYNDQGRRFLYKIIDFQNNQRNSDWLNDTDYINPVIEYLREVKPEDNL